MDSLLLLGWGKEPSVETAEGPVCWAMKTTMRLAPAKGNGFAAFHGSDCNPLSAGSAAVRCTEMDKKTAALQAAVGATPVAFREIRSLTKAPATCMVDTGLVPAAGLGMRLRAGALEIRVFTAFAVRAVPRRIAVAVGSFLLSVHAGFLAGSAAAVSRVLGGALGCRTAGVAAEERPGVSAAAACLLEAAPLTFVLTGPIAHAACVGVVRQMDHYCFSSWLKVDSPPQTAAIYGPAEPGSVGQVGPGL